MTHVAAYEFHCRYNSPFFSARSQLLSVPLKLTVNTSPFVSETNSPKICVNLCKMYIKYKRKSSSRSADQRILRCDWLRCLNPAI